MSELQEQGEYVPRIFLGPAGSEFVGTLPDGTPVTAGIEAGVGPMAEITEHVVMSRDERLAFQDRFTWDPERGWVEKKKEER